MTMTAVEKTLFGSDYKYLEPIQLKKVNISKIRSLKQT